MGAPSRCAAVAVALAGCLSAPPSSSVQAGADAGPTACSPGKEMVPVEASNASPIDEGNACAVDNALAADGAEAGLDRFGEVDCAPLDPDQTEYGGCGCVAVDFGGVLPLAILSVRARWLPDACGYPCTTGCDTGRTIDVWVAEEPGMYRFAEHVGLEGSDLADYPVVTGGQVRFAVVCRDWYGADSADVAVDSIDGTCE